MPIAPRQRCCTVDARTATSTARFSLMSPRRQPTSNMSDSSLASGPSGANRPVSTSIDGDDWTPDSTPYVEGYDVAPDTVPAMVGVGVPAVVAVVPTRNPGPWLETMLASLAAQEYANLTTLVIDAGSVVDVAARVAEVLPNAFVKRVREPSFAVAANDALGTIEGASFYLFCHDDVELRPGAVQALVEEAFRSNAGIVGAKLVDWDHDDHLRSVGGSIDKFGFSWPIAEPDELDQAQHDAVREAFVVSSATMLVRADLFADLGGFSTDIDGWGEALDLCWRAKIAGGRTVVMPAAVVRHRERSELADPTGRSQHVALRHQARIMLVCYSPLQLVRIGPQALILAILDMIGALLRGRVATARDVGSAIVWNVAHLPTTLRIRGRVKRSRRIRDHEIRRMQVKGSVRVVSFLRQRAAAERSLASTLAAAARGRPAEGEGDGDGYWPVAAFVASAVVLFVGSRTLIGSGVPAVREFVPLGEPSQLLAEWWSGWRTPGVGSASGAPTINVLAAVLSWLTFGSTGLVRTALILAPLPWGAWASWRLLRGCASPQARAAALVTYLVNPLPYNAIAEGRWQALVVYGAAPALLGRIARAGEWAPFDRANPSPGSVQRQIVGLGLVVAFATTFAPVTVFVTIVMCVLIAAVLGALTRTGRPGRAVLVTGGALTFSAVLHLPWTLALLGSSNRWSVLAGADPGRRTPLSLRDAVLFDTGPHGGWVSLGLMVVAAVALLISARERFRWSALAAALIVSSLAAVVAAGRLAPSIALPAPEVLLAPAAVGIVLAAALGVEAFRLDVVGGAFGARQVLSLLAAVAVAVSSLPLIVDFVGGRWLAPVSDIDVALRPIGKAGGVENSRTLWIGDADALSVQGWPLADGMKFALTDGVAPTVSSLFPPEAGDAEHEMRTALRDAMEGRSGRLGAELSRFGVRYVVVAQRLAPLPYGRTTFPIDAALDDHLNEQFDLARIEVAPGIEVYENLAFLPVRSTFTAGAGQAGEGSTDAADPEVDRSAVEAWDGTGRPPVRYEGDVPADRRILVLSAIDGGWTMTVDGDEVESSRAFGWAASYPTGSGGHAELAYSTPALQVVLHLLQFVVLGSIPWVRRRRVSEFRTRRSRSHQPPSLEHPDGDIPEGADPDALTRAGDTT